MQGPNVDAYYSRPLAIEMKERRLSPSGSVSNGSLGNPSLRNQLFGDVRYGAAL
jgi:hypothetical protein